MSAEENKKNVHMELEERLTDLMRFCIDNDIPFFSTFALEENGKTTYVNRAVTPIELNVELSNDRITKYAASLNENLVLRFKGSRPNVVTGDVVANMLDEMDDLM